MFQNITAAAPDPILGLTEAFNADDNPKKINLGVGVYKDSKGTTPILASVRKAARKLIEEESTKSYLPIDGAAAYSQETQKLLFGSDSELLTSGRAKTSHTPGGTGALRVAGDYLNNHHADATLWLSQPTWANHPAIFAAAGVKTDSYRYYNEESHGLDLDGMLASLDKAHEGDVVLLHGCCHNPCGVDPNVEQWKSIADTLQRKRLLPLLDFAYQGFANGINEDAAGVRAVLSVCPEALICSSYSKNFGLYRERVGALTLVAATAKEATAVQSNIKIVIRRNYSNPPSHGGALVSAVLSDPGLKQEWEQEVAEMRNRINGMRRALVTALTERNANLSPQGNEFIAEQRGMFSFSGLSKSQVQKLRDEFSVYAVGSGRINVAGVTETNLPYLADSLAAVLS